MPDDSMVIHAMVAKATVTAANAPVPGSSALICGVAVSELFTYLGTVYPRVAFV